MAISERCLLAYMPVLGLAALFNTRRTEEEAFHSRQGFVLFALEILCSMCCFIPKAGVFIFLLILLITFGLRIRVIVSLRREERYAIPWVSTLAEILEL